MRTTFALLVCGTLAVACSSKTTMDTEPTSVQPSAAVQHATFAAG
jgi:hypothetical protein